MREPRRFFVEGVDEDAVLVGEEFEHAARVLRIDAGEEIILLDNSGKEYHAVVTEVSKKEIKYKVVKIEEGANEAATDVALLFGLLKNPDKNELIVQKAVELGVKKIVAFDSEFSSAYASEKKLDRLNKISKEAAKQCRRSVAPPVQYFDSLVGALEAAGEYQNKLFACEFAKESETDLRALSGSTAIVIGSEGGFSVQEAELAQKMGYRLVSLGKRILRAETAAIALTAVVMYHLRELG